MPISNLYLFGKVLCIVSYMCVCEPIIIDRFHLGFLANDEENDCREFAATLVHPVFWPGEKQSGGKKARKSLSFIGSVDELVGFDARLLDRSLVIPCMAEQSTTMDITLFG